MCSDYSINQLFPVSLPFLKPPYSLRHNNIEIRPINNSTKASECAGERMSHTCLALNQNLEMMKLSEVGMSKSSSFTSEPHCEYKGKVLEGH